MNYWGAENSWRPDSQKRVGLDYWKAVNVNRHQDQTWWLETWAGCVWQSSTEFSADYNAVVVSNATRVGVRRPRRGLALISPYVAFESSATTKEAYYWENRLLLGGGVRLSPTLNARVESWLSRYVVYAEVLTTAAYYRGSPATAVPKTDVRFGIAASIGDWYK